MLSSFGWAKRFKLGLNFGNGSETGLIMTSSPQVPNHFPLFPLWSAPV